METLLSIIAIALIIADIIFALIMVEIKHTTDLLEGTRDLCEGLNHDWMQIHAITVDLAKVLSDERYRRFKKEKGMDI